MRVNSRNIGQGELLDSKEADWLYATYNMGRLSKKNLRKQLKRLARDLATSRSSNLAEEMARK
jgi:hypothetical protein